MGFDPRDVPVSRTYDLADVGEAEAAVREMVEAGFAGRSEGFRVLMPKDPGRARRIGYAVTTGITHGLRQKGEPRDVRYWTYHHDDSHYAIVLIAGPAAGPGT